MSRTILGIGGTMKEENRHLLYDKYMRLAGISIAIQNF